MFCTRTRFLGLTVLLAMGLALLGARAASADGPSGIELVTAKDSPLGQGERIAFLGDSITQAGAGPNGYARLIDEAIAKGKPDLGVKVIYAGISGNRVPDLQKRLDRDVLSKKPTVVFIYIGINDVWHSQHGRGTPKDQYEAGLSSTLNDGKRAALAAATRIPDRPKSGRLIST